MDRDVRGTKMTQRKTPASDFIRQTSREYSIYVCQHRAIPSVIDGFKDVQRKLTWTLKSKADKIKTVALGSEIISTELYLHGDASSSAAAGLMAAPYVNNIPLFTGIGTFGTRVSPVDGIGAPRYTYVKKGKALEKLILTDSDIVPLVENHDGSRLLAAYFLPLIPTVLLNGSSGIAVGWSTEILRRKFNDIVDASIAVLEGKKIKRLVPHYELYNIGVNHVEGNTWEFVGTVDVKDASTLHVTELPPDLSLEKFKERLNTMEETGSINTYIDNSTKTIDITIKMPRGAVRGWNQNTAIDFLKLKQKKTERIVVVDFGGDTIKQYDTAEEVVQKFVEWRLAWYETRYEKMLRDATHRRNYYHAIKKCFDDKFPAKLTGFKNKKEVSDSIKSICKDIPLDDNQIENITGLSSYRWAKDYYEDVINNIAELDSKISEYELILSSEEIRREIYKTELMELRKEKF